MAVFMACLNVGDTFLGLNLSHGGHLSHGSPVNMSGINYKALEYSVKEEDGRVDYDQLERVARENKPKLIIAGASAYSREWEYARIRKVADEIGAIFMVDMAHPAGLIAAGLLDNPVKYAHIVTSTTHKTLRGPRGGLILTNNEYIAKKINSAIFPGTQGGPLMHVIAAKAVCFGEALKPEFKEYGAQIVKNAKVLADTLLEKGFQLVSGGTDNHLMLVDLTSKNITGKVAQNLLDEVGITANKNTIPFEKLSPFVTSGIRLGSPALTTRGFKEEDMVEVANIIALVLDNPEDESAREQARQRVAALCAKYPLYE